MNLNQARFILTLQLQLTDRYRKNSNSEQAVAVKSHTAAEKGILIYLSFFSYKREQNCAHNLNDKV